MDQNQWRFGLFLCLFFAIYLWVKFYPYGNYKRCS